MLGLAQTGTGKTAAFVLPILQRLLEHRGPGPRALVVAPTRELAAQIQADFVRLAKHTQLSSTAIFGGVSMARQVQALRRNPDVVVGCPGRLLDLVGQRALKLDRIEVLVLDEADHMFDMGFLPDVKRILHALPPRRQNLLFAATMPREIRGLADSVLQKPARVELAHSKPAETIEHALYPLDEHDKVAVLERLLAGPEFRSAIVFLRTKRRTKRLAERLDARGHRAVMMQGNMSQPQRERALQGFREGRFDVLVATDIAARGLDIAGVSHVVNFDVPGTPEAYTHRIGRTGRSEQLGTAFTFVTPADDEAVRAIEKCLGTRIERRKLADHGVLERVTLGGSSKSGSTSSGRGRGGPRPARGGQRQPTRSWRGFARPAAPVASQPAASPSRFGQGVVDERGGPRPARLEEERNARRRRWKRRRA